MAHIRVSIILNVTALLWQLGTGVAEAVPVVWTGPSVSFTKQGEDDINMPEFQDRLTDNVWLTRDSSEGPFNIAPGRETSYVRFTSPADTKWATSVMAANVGKSITATNWAQLTFTDWAPAFGGPGRSLESNILTRNAVVHLLTDDIYLDLAFTDFDSSGIIAYDRSTPDVPPPTGDYNGNGVVDAADYVFWRATLDQSADPIGSGADGNADGTIESGDYDFWRERFGNIVGGGTGLGAAAAVPEPVAGAQLVIAFLMVCNLPCKRRMLRPISTAASKNMLA